MSIHCSHYLRHIYSSSHFLSEGMLLPVDSTLSICVFLRDATTGENVEPGEIEEAALRSSMIQQIVVIGQVKIQSFTQVVYIGLSLHAILGQSM